MPGSVQTQRIMLMIDPASSRIISIGITVGRRPLAKRSIAMASEGISSKSRVLRTGTIDDLSTCDECLPIGKERPAPSLPSH